MKMGKIPEQRLVSYEVMSAVAVREERNRPISDPEVLALIKTEPKDPLPTRQVGQKVKKSA